MDRIAVGRIGKSHGLKGWVRVHSYSGETGHFRRMETAELLPGEREAERKRTAPREREVAIEAVQERVGVVLMKFRGVDTAEQARSLTGREMWVDRSHAAPLREDEYYLQDLVDCRVFLHDEERGRVRAVWDNGHNDFLEVELADGSTRNVPFHREYVTEVDIHARRIVVGFPEVLE